MSDMGAGAKGVERCPNGVFSHGDSQTTTSSGPQTINMITDTAQSTGDFVQATVNETPALVVYGANTA